MIYKIRSGDFFVFSKRIVIIFFIVCLLFSSLLHVNAEGMPIDVSNVQAALLMETDSKNVLFDFNVNQNFPIAGLVRLAPLLVVCDCFDNSLISSNTSVTVSPGSASIKGSTAFLSIGETALASDLLRASVMINAGDALHALLISIFQTEESAVRAINMRLSELKIEREYESIFDDSITFTPYELGIIGDSLLKSESFMMYSTLYLEYFKHSNGAKDTELVNPNKLIKQYSGCLGVATGYSTAAGYCGVFAAKRGETSFIAVVMGGNNSSNRFSCGMEMLDYGFSHYRSLNTVEKGQVICEVHVVGAIAQTVTLIAENNVKILLNVEAANYTSQTTINEQITAPVHEGQVLGKITYFDSQNNCVGSVNLISMNEVSAATLGDYIKFVLRSWLS